ncbi:MAG: hypothetical protein NZL87_03465 [Thermomicrobium sp.]|nr:hypothetical protein [Thermomicrobium sp.]MCS7246354.1 hypothetical protein [Thermomicrobium sp.]MDW7982395.1 hypothetical protein [Thermomicrobium sp.]
MAGLPGRQWVMLLFGFVLGTASGLTVAFALKRPFRLTRVEARPPDPAIFLQ